jgi:hypothetical protein
MTERRVEVITKDFRGPDRRQYQYTEEELDALQEKLLLRIYADIGKSFVKKILWLVGAVFTALYVMIQHSEVIAKLWPK